MLHALEDKVSWYKRLQMKDKHQVFYFKSVLKFKLTKVNIKRDVTNDRKVSRLKLLHYRVN